MTGDSERQPLLTTAWEGTTGRKSGAWASRLAGACGRATSYKLFAASKFWCEHYCLADAGCRAFDFGTVWVNTHIPLVAEMPHGGFKQSGGGKDLSAYGFEEYTRVKHVMSKL